MQKRFFRPDNKSLLVIFVIVISLILLTFLTSYYGSTDIGDYADVAKFFAGDYHSKIRNSHSYLYGFILSPFIKLTESFIFFKIFSLIFLFLIIYSVYSITSKNRKALWLMLFSPIVWYMAPWISPIQISSLLLLWAYHFVKKYDETGKTMFLLSSGLLIGLGWAVWDTIIYFGVFLAISFLYNKKTSHFFYYILFIFIGLTPRLFLDQFLFNFAFLTTIKTFMAGLVSTFLGGIYNQGGLEANKFLNYIPVFLSIPVYYWTLYFKGRFKQNKKTLIFLTLSVILILLNPQIRYLLSIAPIIILSLVPEMDEKKFKIQIILLLIASVIFIIPYIIQINHNIYTGSIYEQFNGADFTLIFLNLKKTEISQNLLSEQIINDLNEISENHPNETFVVGNFDDSYQGLAHFYWGNNIKEFVSIQDYNLWKENKTIIFEKKFMSSPNINDRRQVWVSGGISKNENDNTNYSEIKFAIGVNRPVELEGAVLIDKYNVLYLSEISQ